MLRTPQSSFHQGHLQICRQTGGTTTSTLVLSEPPGAAPTQSCGDDSGLQEGFYQRGVVKNPQRLL